MSLDVTSLSIKVVSQGIKEASSALSGLSVSAGNAEKRVSSLTNAMKVLNTANAESSKFAEALMIKLREQDGLLRTMAGNSRTAAGGTQALAAAMALLSTSLNLLTRQQQQATQQQHQHTNAMREAHAAARGLSGSLGALWMTYGNPAGMAMGIALGASMKGIVSVGTDVENTLEGIRVRGGETIEATMKVRDAIFKIGEGVYGPQEVAKAFESLTLAGLKSKESVLAIGAALNLATVGGTTIEKAAESLVTIGTAVGATAKSFDYLADGIAAAANSSLASVDSIAESVKRASIVNKLYGASFEDILTQTAALAQVGIKNTAAGTAITNFYNNSIGRTDKARAALNALGMSFTDATGKAKPLADAFEEFTTKLNKYDLKSQQNIINDIFGERALRDVEALRDAVNRSADDTSKYSNKLREIQGQIGDAAGTSAIQAAQLGLTTQKQLDSVANTLKTSFAKAFEATGDSLLGITQQLKVAFGSPEFVTGITNIATAIGEMALALVKNIDLVGYLVEGFILFKAVSIGAGIFQALAGFLLQVATGYGAVTVAASGATVATGAFGLAIKLLPGVGIILTAITALWVLMGTKTDDVKTKTEELANVYNTNLLQALRDEAERLAETNRLLAQGVSETDALTRSTKNLALAKMQANNQQTVASAQEEVDKLKPEYDLKSVRDFNFNKATSPYLKALDNLNRLRTKARAEETEAGELANKIIFESEQKKAAYKAEQYAKDLAAQERAGTQTFGGAKPDTAGANDIYSTQLTRIRGEVEAGKRELQRIEESFTNKFKAGLISEFDQIDAISDARIKKLQDDVSKFQRMIDVAAPKNKGNVTALVKNEMTGAQDKLADERTRREEAYSVVYAKMQEENYNNHYKQLTLQGKNEEAAIEKSKKLYETKLATEKMTLLESLQQLSVATGPQADELQKKVSVLSQHIAFMQSESDALTSKGKLDDAELATQKAFENLRVGIASINAAVPKGGLLAGIAADADIARLKERAIPTLEELYQVQLKLAMLPDAPPDAMKNAAKTAELLADVKKKSGGIDAWKGAQQSLREYAAEAANDGALIGGVMTNAFKSAEDALYNFMATGKLNFKSFAASVISDLARIHAKKMIALAMGGEGSSGDSLGGGIMGSIIKMGIGAIAGAFTGGAPMGTFDVSAGTLPTAIGSTTSMDFFADGGDPPVGVASMVGERGPELFVPKQAGTIIPNHMLSTGGSAPQQGNSDRPMQYTIVNQTTGRIDSVKEQRLSDDERALIISEAVNATASSLYDTNSRMSKGMRSTHDIQRKR